MALLPPALQRKAAAALGLRAALASMLAVAAAQGANLDYPIYALIAAVLVTDPSPGTSRRLAAHRLAGTVVGALFGALLSSAFAHAIWALGLGVFLMVFLFFVLGLPEAGKLAGYVSGLVVLDHSADPWVYAAARFLETGLGIGAALLVSLVTGRVWKKGPDTES